MLTRQRKLHIQEVLRRDGQVVAKVLSRELGLSEDTIRRDLRELAQEGLCSASTAARSPRRPPWSPSRDASAWRRTRRSPSRARRRRWCAVGRWSSSTAGRRRFRSRAICLAICRVTVVTHSPTVAVELATHPSAEVVLIGGRLFKHSVVAVGAAAAEAIRRIRADVYFMGVTGIHPEAGLTTGDLEEADIKRAFHERAAETIVLASSEKLGAASPYLVAPVSGVSGMIVERSVPAETTAVYERLGVTVTRA